MRNERAERRAAADRANPARHNARHRPNRRTKAGDLWQLGRHRLLCGDATSAGDVERLLRGRRPELCVTDPPYGVSYDPSWRTRQLGDRTQRTGLVAGDDRADWSAAYRLFTGDVLYVWHGGLRAGEVFGHLHQAGFVVRAQIIWRKARLVVSRGHYHWQHEPCWYAVRKGATASWAGDRKQRTVWDCVREPSIDVATEHVAQKPVECLVRALRNHHHPSGVYDPFVGSGSTLIAAEQVGSACYALELMPRYCDLVVARWEALSGRRARHHAG